LIQLHIRLIVVEFICFSQGRKADLNEASRLQEDFMWLRHHHGPTPGEEQAAGDTQPAEPLPEEDISIAGDIANAIPGIDDDTDRGLVKN
jgi:hypothetical protein